MLCGASSRMCSTAASARRETGQTLAEFAIIALALMLVVVGIVDFSRAVYAHNAVASAAREGARYATIHPSDLVGIERAARALVSGLDMREFVVRSTRPDELHVQMEVTYTCRLLSSLLIGYVGGTDGTIVLRGSSLMRVE